MHLSLTDNNFFTQNLPSTLRTDPSGDSVKRSGISRSETETENFPPSTMTACVFLDICQKTPNSLAFCRSSGAPVGGKVEPLEVPATPNRSEHPCKYDRSSELWTLGVTEMVDGSNFHGNPMHRPFLASTSSDSSLNFPHRAMTLSTVDVSGDRRQSVRMQSPEEVRTPCPCPSLTTKPPTEQSTVPYPRRQHPGFRSCNVEFLRCRHIIISYSSCRTQKLQKP